MRIALAQVGSSTDPAANLALVGEYARQASEQDADLVVFPEATMCSFARRSADVAEPFDGPWAEAVRDLAVELGITIVVGMFTAAAGGRVHNTLLIAGSAEARYDKIHLFDALGFAESDVIAPGSEPVVVDIALGRGPTADRGSRGPTPGPTAATGDRVSVGLTTCYDVRFPALYTRLANDGAQVILVCASWASGPNKVHQWRTLVTARAIDSTSFVVGVGQAAVGNVDEPGPPTGVGHSLVVDPTGTVLLELGETPELAFVDLDIDAVADARKSLPVLRHAQF